MVSVIAVLREGVFWQVASPLTVSRPCPGIVGSQTQYINSTGIIDIFFQP
jgi:hypothetical protein